MFLDDMNVAYLSILDEFKDKILIELAGHDHFASLRAHESATGETYHNIFIAPGITPWYNNNPAVSSLEVRKDDDSGTLIPHNLRTTFLNLEPTLGKDEPLSYDELEFRELSFEETYGVKDLTAKSIIDLARRLADDEALHKDYLVRKLGFDPDSQYEVD